MNEWITTALTTLQESPPLQGVVAALCTFILEDTTIVACGLLVADGSMFYMTAFISLTIGIGVGDCGLYAIGRLVGPRTISWGLVSQRRIDRARAWFERNLVAAVFVSRFIPGLRLPTNLGAGITHASPLRFLTLAFMASFVWTLLVLSSVSKVGEMLLPYVGPYKWPIFVAMIAFFALVQYRSVKRMGEEPVSERPIASVFEFWPPAVFYAPVAVYYFWLALKHRSLTLPTAANPSIYSGGMIRESKCEILSMVADDIRTKWIAPHVAFDRPADGAPAQMADAALTALAAAGIDFSFVAKPDRGQRGVGVQPVRTRAELEAYLAAFPAGETICLQRLVEYPNEVGLMYYRFPDEERGRITSITHKTFPHVTGDGVNSLRHLIAIDPRAALMKKMYFARHADELDHVLDNGKRFPLVFAGNHKQGCIFRDGVHLHSPELERRIDEIARAVPGFFFGRFDLRYASEEELRRGEAFTIVEINGAAAESTHIWDPEAQLADAYRTLFEQFRVLFAIGDANRRRGVQPLGPVQFLKDVLLYHRVARHYPSAK